MDSEIPNSETKQSASAPSTVPQVPLGKHTAAALKQEVLEINELQQQPAVIALQTRIALYKRHTDAILRDANLDPDKYASCSVADGALILIPKE